MPLIRKTIKAADAIARSYLAPFVVTCNLGTYRACWTLQEARGWLPACGPEASIRGARAWDLIEQRTWNYRHRRDEE